MTQAYDVSKEYVNGCAVFKVETPNHLTISQMNLVKDDKPITFLADIGGKQLMYKDISQRLVAHVLLSAITLAEQGIENDTVFDIQKLIQFGSFTKPSLQGYETFNRMIKL